MQGRVLRNQKLGLASIISFLCDRLSGQEKGATENVGLAQQGLLLCWPPKSEMKIIRNSDRKGDETYFPVW